MSLDFVNGGSSGNQQEVNVLKLFLGGEDGERLYLCDLTHANNTCSSKDSVTVIQDNHDMWNEIVLELVAGESGEFVYTAAYEIINPGDGSTTNILKPFTVIVNSKWSNYCNVLSKHPCMGIHRPQMGLGTYMYTEKLFALLMYIHADHGIFINSGWALIHLFSLIVT